MLCDETDAYDLLESMFETVETPAMAELNREMMPILAEMLTLGPENHNDHPSAKQLFNWLVDPHRTGEEFCYVVGPLLDSVWALMNDHFEKYIKREGFFNMVIVAAEAIAVTCPILEGSWEYVGWFLVNHLIVRQQGVLSDHFVAWFIQVISLPDLCPSLYLRVRFLHLLENIVDLSGDFGITALESVLSVCSSLSKNHLYIDLDIIKRTLQIFSRYKYCSIFDEQLADELRVIKTSRLFALVYDVACHRAIGPSPKALQGFTALLAALSGFASQMLNIYMEGMEEMEYERFRQMKSDISKLFGVVMQVFPRTCQSSHLIHLVKSCSEAILMLPI